MAVGDGPARPAEGPAAGRLTARPGKPTEKAPSAGVHDLGLARGKDGILILPKGYSADKPVPLVMFLHGALGRTQDLTQFCVAAAGMGMAVAAPDSRSRTWDLILGGYGPDIAFLDRALSYVFSHVAVDPRHLALAGFSDGGSYALSVGVANGDLFTHVMAYSPGFLQPPDRQGQPAIWISHGTRDDILPIDNTSRRIVPRLKQMGYKVSYHEFDGGHGVSSELREESCRWFLA